MAVFPCHGTIVPRPSLYCPSGTRGWMRTTTYSIFLLTVLTSWGKIATWRQSSEVAPLIFPLEKRISHGTIRCRCCDEIERCASADSGDRTDRSGFSALFHCPYGC